MIMFDNSLGYHRLKGNTEAQEGIISTDKDQLPKSSSNQV